MDLKGLASAREQVFRTWRKASHQIVTQEVAGSQFEIQQKTSERVYKNNILRDYEKRQRGNANEIKLKQAKEQPHRIPQDTRDLTKTRDFNENRDLLIHDATNRDTVTD